MTAADGRGFGRFPWIPLGLILLVRLAESAREFEALLEVAPDLPVAHYNSGRVLGQMGQTPRARFHLQRVLDLDPDYDAARQAIASLR